MSKKAHKETKRQRLRNLELALRLERLGLVAIALAFVKESPDPERLLQRLEHMVEAAALNPKTPAKTGTMLNDGLKLVQRAIEQQMGRPQGLFDPDVGHVKPAVVRALVEPPPQTRSLFPADDLTRDGEETERAIRTTLLRALEQGPATDEELAARYAVLGGPRQNRGRLKDHRRELWRLGRIKATDTPDNSPVVWALTERVQT